MTIEEQIEKLKLEIGVAENALKEKVSDINFTHLIKDLTGNLINSSDSQDHSKNLLSLLPARLNNKYGFIFSIFRKLFKLLK